MKRTVGVAVLVACLLAAPIAGQAVEKRQEQQKQTTEKKAISQEDRQVIRHMQLLAMMDMLKDMELLAGDQSAVPEDKQ